jgi:uncharacterized membrane protein/thiol-disulfide isomerase/thioredoxin
MDSRQPDRWGAWRRTLTAILAVGGIGLMIFYSTCNFAACSYLQGDIWGVDLKIVGIAYMASILLLALLNQADLLRILLSGGIGVEVYLVAFQVREDVFCPFCLVFAALVIAAFIVNYQRPAAAGNAWRRWLIGGMGEAALPCKGRIRIPLLIFAFLGYFFVSLTLNGTATPAYGAEKAVFPSFGSGSVEVIAFSDYFCPPCQGLEPQSEPLLAELHAGGRVKVTFVDAPFHKLTALYARHFLFSLQDNGTLQDAVRVRNVLFDAAKNNTAGTEEALKDLLKAKQISWHPVDFKPVFNEWNALLNAYKVRATPTFVIRYSETDVKTFVGTENILEGLKALRTAAGK